MDRRGLKHLGAVALATLAALAGCNAVTGLGELEFSRDPAAPAGSGGAGGSGAGGSVTSGAGAGGTGGASAEPWGRQYGDGVEDFPAALALAPGGDFVLGGTFAGNVDFGEGTVASGDFIADAFVARYDAAGALRFAVPFDTGAADCAMDIAVTAQGDIVTLVGSGMDGSCYSAAYDYQLSLGNNPHGLDRFSLRRVSADGVPGPESPVCDPCSALAVGPLAVATDAAGAVYIAGSFSETSTIAGDNVTAIGEEDVLVMKLGAAGAPVWVKRFGSPGSFGNATDVIVDAQGGVVVAGRFLGELPIGATTHQSTSPNDIFLARLDAATGNPTWSRSFANANVIAPPRLAAASDGILMTGDFISAVTFGGPTLQNADPDGGTADGYLAKLDLAGAHVWSQRIGETPGPLKADQGGTGISFDASGNILLVGGFTGSLDLGDQTLEATSYMDGFAAKLSPSGQVLSAWHMKISVDNSLGDLSVVPGAPGLIVTGAFWGNLDYGGAEPLASKAQSQGRDDIFVVGLPLP